MQRHAHKWLRSRASHRYLTSLSSIGAKSESKPPSSTFHTMTILNDSPKAVPYISPSVNGKPNSTSSTHLATGKTPLLITFLDFHNELEKYK